MLKRLLADLSWVDLPKYAVIIWLSFHFAFLCHEFGHYLGARLFGIRPTSLVVGDYGTFYTRTHAGTTFIFRAVMMPWGTATTTIGPGTMSLYGVLCFLFGGVFFNLAIGTIIGYIGFRFESLALLTVAMISIVLGADQLIPTDSKDGHKLWIVLTTKQLK